MTQAMNQLKQTTEKGQVDLAINPTIVSVVITGTSLVAGQAVKIVDDSSAVPKVQALAADTDSTFGVLVRNLKDATYSTGDMAELALGNSVVTMEAGAAIAKGAALEYDVSEVKVITSAGTNPRIGTALDKATADGNLIRVMLATPIVDQP